MSDKQTIGNDEAFLDRTRDAGLCRSLDCLSPLGIDGLELRYGIGRTWAWPKDDDILWATMLLEHQHADALVRLTRRRREMAHRRGTMAVLQAGAACGVMPWKLAQHDDVVVRSFEAQRLNHLAAHLNLMNTPRACVHYGALMAETGWTGMRATEPVNAGAWQVADTREHAVPCFSSRDLGIIDLLWLDIEGMEFSVLSGMMAQLEGSNRPCVIALELKGLAADFGWSDEWTISFLQGHGYEHTAWIGNDMVFEWPVT